ncbi:MAG: myristoyl transferase [Candidatus Eremiobacteraeota bacterium]|nr:myristoyl transferase [Candidatus Eremiobacteraeota bacterium]
MNLGSRLAALAVAGAVLTAPAAAQQKTEQVTVAQAFQSVQYLPLYVGIDKGFFKKHGLDVVKTTAGGGANGVASVIQGSAMFSLQDPMTAVLANLKGAKLRNVAAVVNGVPVWLIVKKDAPIKSVADLAGKTISTAIPPSTSTYLLRDILAKQHVKATEQDVLIGTEIAPLLAGKVDAAAVYEPYVEQALAQGCRVLYEFAKAVPGGYAFSTITAADSTIQNKPQTVQAFVSALDEAIHYMHADPAGATEVAVSEFPQLSPEIVRASVKRMFQDDVYPKSAMIEPSAFANALALQVAIGNIKSEAVTYAAAIDPQFAKKVAAK